MRDPHGNYAVQIPHLPPLEDGQPQEDEATEKESVLDNFGNSTHVTDTNPRD